MRTSSKYYSAAFLSSFVKNKDLMDNLMDPDMIDNTDQYVHQYVTCAINDYNINVFNKNKFDCINSLYQYFNEQKAIQNTQYPSIQSKLFDNIDRKSYQNIFDNANIRDKAILMQYKDKKCHTWLHARKNEININNIQFDISMRRRLRLPLQFGNSQCMSCMQHMNNNYGDHAIICATHGHLKNRHNKIAILIANVAREAGYVVETEQKIDIGSTQIPADVLIKNINGCNIAIDVSIVACTNPTYLPLSTTKIRHAATIAFNNKINKYKNYDFESHNTIFKPFILEEFGAMHFEAKKLWNNLCDVIARRTDQKPEYVKFLKGKILNGNLNRIEVEVEVEACLYVN